MDKLFVFSWGNYRLKQTFSCHGLNFLFLKTNSDIFINIETKKLYLMLTHLNILYYC